MTLTGVGSNGFFGGTDLTRRRLENATSAGMSGASDAITWSNS